MAEAKTKRNDIMKEQRAERWTLQEIADYHGVTRERVRQIVGNSGRARRWNTRRAK